MHIIHIFPHSLFKYFFEFWILLINVLQCYLKWHTPYKFSLSWGHDGQASDFLYFSCFIVYKFNEKTKNDNVLVSLSILVQPFSGFQISNF